MTKGNGQVEEAASVGDLDVGNLDISSIQDEFYAGLELVAKLIFLKLQRPVMNSIILDSHLRSQDSPAYLITALTVISLSH